MAHAIRTAVMTGACAALAACASTPVAENYQPRLTRFSEPSVGEVEAAGVGETLLRAGEMQELEALQVLDAVRIGGLASYTVGPGYYVKRGEDERGEFFTVGFGPGAGSVSAGAIAQPLASLLLRRDGDTLCALSVAGGSACRSHAAVKRTRVRATGGVQQTLIYKGRMGARVRIGYREISGDLTRGEASNDVDYELKGSGVIGYKGARLEIIQATNQHVLYKVVRGFGVPGGDEMTASAETTTRAALPAYPTATTSVKGLNPKLK